MSNVGLGWWPLYIRGHLLNVLELCVIFTHCWHIVDQQVMLLRDLAPTTVNAITPLLRLQTVLKGDVVVRQGERSADLYVTLRTLSND